MSALVLALVVGAAVVTLGVLPVLRARHRWYRLRGGRGQRLLAIPAGFTATTDGSGSRAARVRWRVWLVTHPVRFAAITATATGAIGYGLAGVVCGIVLGGYGAAAVVVLVRHLHASAEARSRVAAVDAVAGLAAELRAGVTVAPALARVHEGLDPLGSTRGGQAVYARLAAAVALAESSGAALADVLDRLDVHLRAIQRARASAEAQAAGAVASAGLLAVMPLAGAGLGALIGLDPVQVLLHTPIGSACLIAAVVLQLAGLAWAARLSRVEVAV